MTVDYKVVTTGTYILTLTEQERMSLITYLRMAGSDVAKSGELYIGIDRMLRELGVTGLT